MSLKRWVLGAMVAVACGFVGGQAQAETVTARMSQGLGQNVTIWIDGKKTQNQWAGEFEWQTSEGDVFTSFCIDIDAYIQAGKTYDYTPMPIEDRWATHGQTVEQFWGAYYDQVTTNASAAAFQLGVWEILFGDRFKATGAAWDQALTWIDGLASYTGPSTALTALVGKGHQDQATVRPEDPSVVPTPAAAGLGLLGLLGLAMRRRQSC